jgi:hypothetical protein
MDNRHRELSAKVEEIEPSSFSLQVAGWVWGISLTLVLSAVASEGIRIFASFLLIPLLGAGIPIASAIGMLYGLRGMKTAQRERAILGFVLNAAACAALAIAASVFLNN